MKDAGRPGTGARWPRGCGRSWRAATAARSAVTFVDEEGRSDKLPAEFATATMGHILLGQGRRDEARTVFKRCWRATLHDEPARSG